MLKFPNFAKFNFRYSDILMEDAENDPSGQRSSRTRRPRAVSTQSSLASVGGREREFNGFNGGSDLSSAISGAAAAANNAAEDTEALLRKLRNL